MSQRNKALVRRAVEEVYNQGQLAVVDELVAGDFVIHSSSADIRGPEGTKQYVAALRAAFPDLHITIEDQFAEGDRVATRWTARGTHTGAFEGLPPTGKQVRVTAIDIDRIADGKVVECWTNMDELGLLQQLGALPAPEQAGQAAG
ncbi:MAG TPA: ester cyclase [Thermomicrobiales bacterium]|nr:ester cyclase [Thermomicrobiales bacterium]